MNVTKKKTTKTCSNLHSTIHVFLLSTLSSIIGLTFFAFFSPSSSANLADEKTEMTRLEQQADDLIANGDPNGAALSIGKAAMMAGILAKQESASNLKSVYRGIEALFRTQENGYRAIALFEQAGGQPPAPNGACQLLNLGNQQSKKAQRVFSITNLYEPPEASLLAQDYSLRSQEWNNIIQELQAEFSCLSPAYVQ